MKDEFKKEILDLLKERVSPKTEKAKEIIRYSASCGDSIAILSEVSYDQKTIKYLKEEGFDVEEEFVNKDSFRLVVKW